MRVFGLTDDHWYPADWWDRTPVLSGIRDYARSGGTRPEAVYAALLSTAAARIPLGVQTPIGTEPTVRVGILSDSIPAASDALTDAEAILPVPIRVRKGTLPDFVARLLHQQRVGLPPTLYFRPKPNHGTYKQLFGHGPRHGNQFRALCSGEEVHVPTLGTLAGGSYRVSVCESFTYNQTWMSLPQVTYDRDRFLFVVAAPCDPEFRGAGRPVPEVRLPRFTQAGPQPMPTNADPDADPIRFAVLTLHAALHGREVPTVQDWDATEVPDATSRLFRAKLSREKNNGWGWSDAFQSPRNYRQENP